MPHWLFALILLICICALGVYITKGMEGFLSIRDTVLSAPPLPTLRTPSSTVTSSYTTKIDCSKYKGSDCDTIHACCIQGCYSNIPCLMKCGYDFNYCKEKGPKKDSDANSWFTSLPWSHRTPSSNSSHQTPSSSWFQQFYSPSSKHLNLPRHDNSDFLYSPNRSQLETAQSKHQMPHGVIPYSGDMENTSAMYESLNSVQPALRNLIRSDMDEAVTGLVDKEILQLQNEYEV